MKTSIDLIQEERQRQIEKEGWSTTHDDLHINGELSDAAAVYTALPNNIFIYDKSLKNQHRFIELWPWGQTWLKPTPQNRLRELTKAGALIVAEMDRIQRLYNKKK